MADEKRGSARMGPATGNRASNRGVAPAGQAAGSGVRRAAPVVEAAPPPPPPPPTRSSNVQRRPAGAPVMKKKQKLPMKEILIAAGALAAILVIALVIGYFKKSTVSELEGKNRAQVEILERNVKLATDELKKAVGLGTLYCVGKETGELKDTSAKLLAPFKSNPKIYNIFYGRDFKDKKQAEKHEQIALNDDQEHRTLDELNKAIPEDLNKAIQEDKDLKDATVKYAMAHEGDKKIAVIIAKKIVRSAKEDNVNSGGQITVIVRAEEDDFFKKAMSKTFDAPVKAPETKPAATDAKK